MKNHFSKELIKIVILAKHLEPHKSYKQLFKEFKVSKKNQKILLYIILSSFTKKLI